MPKIDYAFQDLINMISNGIDDIELVDEMIDELNEGTPMQFKVVIRVGKFYFERIWKVDRSELKDAD